MSVKSRSGAGSAWGVVLVLLGGCDDPLVERQTVTGLRVLAVKVEAAGDPERATLAPGDAGEVVWLVVSDQGEEVTALVEYCRARPASAGIPECASAPFLEQRVEGQAPFDLRTPIQLPEDIAEGAEWLAKLALCGRGIPGFDRRGRGRCDGVGMALEAFQRASVVDDPNRNPNLDDSELKLDGEAWAPPGELLVPRSDCVAALPEVSRGDTQAIRFALLDGDGEPSEGGYEGLIFSHVATVKGVSRPFSFIDAEGTARGFELELTLPDELELPADGAVFDFFLTVRDQHGGADWLRRQACARR